MCSGLGPVPGWGTAGAESETGGIRASRRPLGHVPPLEEADVQFHGDSGMWGSSGISSQCLSQGDWQPAGRRLLCNVCVSVLSGLSRLVITPGLAEEMSL